MAETQMVTQVLVAASVLVAGCQRFDPLTVSENGQGHQFVDVLMGTRTRVLCVGEVRARETCPYGRNVEVREVPDFGQLIAEWRRTDPATVDVYLFGGDVVRCEPHIGEIGVRVALHRLPLAEMGERNGWDEAKVAQFARAPDLCGREDQTAVR